MTKRTLSGRAIALVILAGLLGLTGVNLALSQSQPEAAKEDSHKTETPTPDKSDVGTVPTLPDACPILGHCTLPGDDRRSKGEERKPQ
jgi:hypothetical protein